MGLAISLGLQEVGARWSLALPDVCSAQPLGPLSTALPGSQWACVCVMCSCVANRLQTTKAEGTYRVVRGELEVQVALELVCLAPRAGDVALDLIVVPLHAGHTQQQFSAGLLHAAGTGTENVITTSWEACPGQRRALAVVAPAAKGQWDARTTARLFWVWVAGVRQRAA